MSFPVIRVKDADGNIVQINSQPNPGQTNSDNSLSVISSALMVSPWANGAAAQDFRAYKYIQVQVSALSGNDTISFSRSLDGSSYSVQQGITQDWNLSGQNISANGIYSFPAGGYFTWTKTGTASSPVIAVRAEG